MPQLIVGRTGGIAYRKAERSHASERSPVLCLHGWPQSSYMWRHLLPALASSGRTALAPDLAGFGDSPPDLPGTLERQVDVVEGFRQQMGLDRVVLVVHDTGGVIGLRWACEHPDAVSGLVISNTGFFPDIEWAAIAKTMRTPIQGEALVNSLSREGFSAMLEETASGFNQRAIDEYWKAFSTAASRRGMLELYRSFDLDELKPYHRKLAKLGVPTLILWGQRDEFLPLDYASRFAREIPGSKLVLLEEVRHFLFEDEPERCAEEVIEFLRQAGL
ncbi:MAG: alpha/beta fold hydrolase [Actinomycetota bacterium]|nr:alpha/beta fold hydrolase [Actinomycetota bacterium]